MAQQKLESGPEMERPVGPLFQRSWFTTASSSGETLLNRNVTALHII